MKNIFEESLIWYKSQVEKNDGNSLIRIEQLDNVVNSIGDKFNFNKIVCFETGASANWADGGVGAFFAKACELSGGEFHSVDVSEDQVDKSIYFYSELNLSPQHYIQDSVKFLEQVEVVPNLVHLDSWDLDLHNPFPSALHGWNEFIAIEDKMPIGSILIIDDNFFKGSYVQWNYPNGESEHINIKYPIVGKGTNVWHFVESGESNWTKLSQDHKGKNVKLVYQKIKTNNYKFHLV